MNKFSIRKIKNKLYGNEEYTCLIDDVSIQEWLDGIAKDSDDKQLKEWGDLLGLAFAFTDDLNWKSDTRFISELFNMDSAIIPILVCEDDLDLNCIVIVIEVEKKDGRVFWKRIGYVNHQFEDFEKEKASGILCTEAYTKEDWEKYGDNIALEKVDSPAWLKWVNENTYEELFRRCMNYTLPYYKTEGNVIWLKDLNWIFDKLEYEKTIDEYRKRIVVND